MKHILSVAVVVALGIAGAACCNANEAELCGQVDAGS
jgi:hypothetical protein